MIAFRRSPRSEQWAPIRAPSTSSVMPSSARTWTCVPAAILAADKSAKDPQLITRLRAALDDPDPQVAYAAATTLWKMHDSSGEDLLLAVAAGDAHDKLGMIKAEKHKAAKDLHSPGALAKIPLAFPMQGSGFFLGPPSDSA